MGEAGGGLRLLSSPGAGEAPQVPLQIHKNWLGQAIPSLIIINLIWLGHTNGRGFGLVG